MRLSTDNAPAAQVGLRWRCGQAAVKDARKAGIEQVTAAGLACGIFCSALSSAANAIASAGLSGVAEHIMRGYDEDRCS